MTEKIAEHFLKPGKAAEQGYKACTGLIKLEQRYGKSRLEAACSKTLAYSNASSLRTVASILKNGLDKPGKAESQSAQPKSNSYGITRGAAYFGRGPLMLNQATMDMLTAMKMTAMAAEFASQLKPCVQ